ncbi:MAG: GspE/PulE family protein [Patescibacteria group bacterium]|nr:GspE/PulE family protein [Patescibacteria group bacterium]
MILLQELAKRGLIKEELIPEVIKVSEEKYKGNIDEALADFSIGEDKILEIKGSLFNIPVKNIDPKEIPTKTFKFIPFDSAKLYGFVPIGLSDDVLEVGVTNPENIRAMDALQFISSKINKPFKVYLVSLSNFNKILEVYKGIGTEVDQALSELDDEISKAGDGGVKIETKQQDKLKPGEEERIVEEAPIIKIVAVLLRHATEGGASDIHIENVGDKVKVRFRVDGILHTSLILPLNVYNGVIARIKILAKLRLDEKRKPQDGGFSAKIDGRKIDFRVSTLPSYFGEKIAMRILDSEKGIKKLEEVGFSKENLALIKKALKRPYGLVLITGPTGSGKTTTLYSMINEINDETKNIISLEDPVEYQIDGINQSQVMPEIGYTFASGLRSILRQDPNIIMVGEIRDKETAQLAIQAALTGHLVFSTLHTNNSIGAIPRLIDMGVDPYLIAPTLALAVAQRLMRKIHPNSRKEIEMDNATKTMIDKQFEDLPDEFKKKIEIKDKMYEHVPSKECSSGLKGRIPVFEMFEIDKGLQDLILKSPGENDIYKYVRAKGMLTMKEDAILKNIKGEIPFQEVYRL